ncbi:MAG: metallophosphoesterase family protein [Shimia sp.]
MPRLLHTADLHLDSPLASLALRDETLAQRVATASRTALTRITDLAIAEGCVAVLIAGDLFDRSVHAPSTAAFVQRQFERLDAAGIDVVLIHGNHDAVSRIATALPLPSNVHVLPPEGGSRAIPGTDITVHGVSFGAQHEPKSLLPKMPPPIPGRVNIAMLHTSAAASGGQDPYAPASPTEMAALDYDYWALGHIHRRKVLSEVPPIVMPGTPQARDIGEAGETTVTLLDIDGSGRIAVREASVAPLVFTALTCPLDGAEEGDDLRARITQALAEARSNSQADDVVLRLILTGTPAISPYAMRRDRPDWEAWIAQEMDATHGLWLDSIRWELTPEKGQTGVGRDDLYDAVRAAATDPKAMAEIAEVMAQLPTLLPAGGARDLLPDAEAEGRLTAALTEAAIDDLLGRLARTGAG